VTFIWRPPNLVSHIPCQIGLDKKASLTYTCYLFVIIQNNVFHHDIFIYIKHSITSTSPFPSFVLFPSPAVPFLDNPPSTLKKSLDSVY
jgi:hypothetical protein